MNDSTIHAKPFLRWAGSKKQLIPIIYTYWRNHHKRYFEAFAGSASLFFHIQPKTAILSDINSELIKTYKQIKKNETKVLEKLRKLKIRKQDYYRIRELKPQQLDPAMRAARFIYLNRFCFNGLYRTNRKGEFNVPYGGEKSGSIPAEETFYKCHVALQNACLKTGDFEKVLDMTEHGDFVYLDPPYSNKKIRIFHEYDPSNFNWKDLYRLRLWQEEMTARGVEFLISYADCEEARILKDGYKIQKVEVKRNIAGFAKHRRVVTELLINNRHLLNKNYQ